MNLSADMKCAMENNAVALILLTLGALFILGLLADLIGRHTPLPRVTLLIIAGFVIGPGGLDWLPSYLDNWFPILTNIALSMIGFELGKNLNKKKLNSLGRPILGISLGVMLMTSLVMFIGLSLFGVPIEVALILAGIAPATAPAPVMDVINQTNSKGEFTDTLLGIVAIDDAWGMLMFSLLLVLASILAGNGEVLNSLYFGVWEVFGAIVLGLLLGFPMAYISRHVYPGKATQAEVLGIVLLCAGAALYLHVSYILAAMVMGIIVANVNENHRDREFEELEALQWPLMILFFLFAGAQLQIQTLGQSGLIGLFYVILRVLGRLSGSWLGASWAQGPKARYRWMGLALLPHAGIPIGMVLVANQHFPEHESLLLAVILSATVIFELIGPAMTKYQLTQVRDVRK